MLLVPIITGAAAGSPHGAGFIWIFILAAAALSLFCLRTPLEAQLRISAIRPQSDGERKLVHFFISIYAFAAVLALAAIITCAHSFGLVLLGAAAAMAFLLQAVLKRMGRATRMNSQLVGAIALSSSGAAAYYLATGHFGATALVVWMANWLFTANQIHFVQLRIHSARGIAAPKFIWARSFLFHQLISLLFLVVMWRAGWVPGLILAAFGPLFVRGFVWFFESPQPLRVHRLGVNELLYAVVFGMFFIVGFHHPFL